MEPPLLLSFSSQTVLTEKPQGGVTLASPRGAVSLDSLTPGLLGALKLLGATGVAEEELEDQVREIDGDSALTHLYFYLEQLRVLGLLRYSITAKGELLLSFEPLSPAFQPAVPVTDAGQRFVLSRFAYPRRLQAELVLESPLAHARVILHGSAGCGLLTELTKGCSARELAGAPNEIEEETARQVLGLLAGAALATEIRADGSMREDEDEALAQWEFHDLLFHARSRQGRHGAPTGATYRFLGRIPPRPVIKPRMSDEVIRLFRPDLDRLIQVDLPLTRVIEQRESVREHGERPITAAQVGEFLYRSARVRSVTEPGAAHDRRYGASSRPYPDGGAAYELEVYLIVDRSDGILPGLYHYEPVEHELSQVSGPTVQTEALLRGAAGASGMDGSPQVLVTLAARFQRLSWKYETIAYALALKDVGALLQTMYLVATAMDLAPCALGSGDSDVFAEATGVPYLEESSVGEFMLGSRR